MLLQIEGPGDADDTMTTNQFAAPVRARALAHPNIALVKYWGKADEALNLPAVASLSITLDTLQSDTTVEFMPGGPPGDEVMLNGAAAAPAHCARVERFLDLVRKRAQVAWPARVASTNNFPTAAGLASSASGFAALAVAADAALTLGLSKAELSGLARQGSGSAARSVFGGFVAMAGPQDNTGCARPVLSRADWPLRVVVAITSTERKQHLSTAGMNLTRDTSPYYAAWLASHENDMQAAGAAIEQRDFIALARVSEHSCLKMHGLMLSAEPGLVYWNPATVACIATVRALRESGHPVFFTIDAGPQVKAVCAPDSADVVAAALAATPGVVDTVQVGLGGAARIVADEH